MKRTKSINGYTIYEATSQRDADKYNCEIGCYNIYLSTDIRDFGLSNSYPEYENVDSLTEALNICRASQWAIACALAEEISGSTAQDMDLCLEVEHRLEAGEAVNTIRDSYHTDEDENLGWFDDEDLDLGDDEGSDDDDHPTTDNPGRGSTPEEPPRSHACYYVILTDEGEYITRTVDSSYDTMEGRKRAFFRTVAERLAFSDCSYDTVDEIVWDGRRVEYTGWQPGMVMTCADTVTGEVIYEGSFPEWDH